MMVFQLQIPPIIHHYFKFFDKIFIYLLDKQLFKSILLFN